MKYLITICFLSLTLFCKSQTINKVVKAVYLTYQNSNWAEDRNTYPENMFVILDGKNIKITNKNESKYLVYGEPKIEKSSEVIWYTWTAIDKDGEYCSIMMKKYYEQNGYILNVIYYEKSFAIQFITE